MSRRLTSILAFAAIAMAIGCSRQPAEDPAEAAYQQFRTAYLDAPTRADQIAALEAYLAEHTDHPAAGYYAADLIYYYADALDRPEKAYDSVKAVLPRIDDPEARLYLAAELAPVAKAVGRPLDLGPFIDAIEAEGPLGFDQLDTIMSAACEMEDWELAGSYTDQALARSTPEAYRSDYPDRDFTAEEVAERAQRRRATALTYRGWVLYNKGQPAEALAAFEEADAARVDSYVGVTNGPLDLFWARALLGEGDSAAALERITREALFGDAAEALPIARTAFVEANGGPDGFDDYLWSARVRLAPTVDDFTLADYGGQPHALDDLRRDKVLLLAFWFPT